MGAFLEVERKGRIAILRMNKPESMNAIGTHEDCEDICNTLQTLNDDKGVSCIILTGNGKAFSAADVVYSLKRVQDPKMDSPARASIRKRMTSASAIARSVCARIRPARLSASASSSPAVSITWKYAAGDESVKGFKEAFEKGGGNAWVGAQFSERWCARWVNGA